MKNKITEEQKEKANAQIRELRKEIDYDTRDYSIDYLVQQFSENEFFIPDEYQRQFVWENQHRTAFIESILLGLPIPFMFFSDTDDGRCEIIDGAQRTRTLVEFMDNELVLNNLKRLTSLEKFTYEDLPDNFKRKFNKTTMRIIVLSDETTLETRREIFNRINTAGVRANKSEVRRGAYSGPFMDFLKECTENELFISVCPVSDAAKKRYEDLELVLRFFAFLDNYQSFNHRVDEFLDSYVERVQDSFNKDELETDFLNMLRFVDKYFDFGFRKTQKAKSTPRVRFEAISVGVALALREKPNLIPASMDWLYSDEFKKHTTTHASNSQARVRGRIEFVRDMLLAGDNDARDY